MSPRFEWVADFKAVRTARGVAPDRMGRRVMKRIPLNPEPNPPMNGHILLVEDNPDDVKLTLRAFQKQNLGNQIVVANDGEEALDYLFGTGRFAGRDVSQRPAVVFLDLKLPKLDGLEVLRRIRADARTALQPVLSSPRRARSRTGSWGINSAPTASCANRWTSTSSWRPPGSSGFTGCC